MRRPRPPFRSRTLVAVAALACAVVGAMTPPSVAFASPPPGAVHLAEADAPASVSSGDVTWMVRPSDGAGEDGRSWIEAEAAPGSSYSDHLLIRNLSDHDVTFALTAADGYFTQTGRFNMLTRDRPSVDAGTWISLPDSVDVGPGADVVVPFTVSVPENAVPGDHPAGVAASIRTGQGEVGVESRVGFRVMTRVTGSLTPSATGQVEGRYAPSWNPFEPGRIDVGYTITNTGNTRLSAAPSVTVHSIFGTVVERADADAITEIAPGESRTAQLGIPEVWPLLGFTVTLDAPASVVPAGDGPDVPAVEVSGWTLALPWAQAITAVLAAILLWWLFFENRRRQRRLEALLEEARREGAARGALPVDGVVAALSPRSEDAPATRRARRGLAGGAAVLVLWAAMASLAPDSVAHAATDDSSTVGILVEVTPQPTPTPSVSPAPSNPPSPPPPAALPSTGTSTPIPFVVGGAVLTLVGAGVVASANARRRRAR